MKLSPKNSPLSRKTFLQATVVTGLAALAGCSSDGDDADAAGDGDGDMSGDGDGSGGMTGDGDGDGDGSGGTSGDGDGDGDGDMGGDDGSGGGDASGGSDGSGGSASGDACTEDIMVTSSGAMHQHTLLVTAAFLNAGVEGTVTSSPGGGDHDHCVTLTVADIDTIKSGGVVRKTTCNGGDHEFVISCAVDAPAPVIPDTCGGGDNQGAAGMCTP